MKSKLFTSLKLVCTVGLLINTAFCQSKQVELAKFYTRTVPAGKVWVISNDKAYKIIFSDGVFESGTACNASIYSNPSFIYGISYYDSLANHSRPKTVGFTFKNTPERYDDDVYLIEPYYLLEADMQQTAVVNSLNWKYQKREIVFYPGMAVFTSSCINNFLIEERDMTQADRKNYQLWLKHPVK